jgi:hypothetical protein
MRVDVRFHRKADLQRMLLELVGLERDAHRNTLDHLDPVSCRVLGGKQGERGARARAKTNDLAVIRDTASVNVSSQGHRLAHPNVRKLRFLEVSVDPHLIERNHGHQSGARAHSLSELDVSARHEARDGRRQLRALICKVCAAHRGSGVTDIGVIGDRGSIHTGTVRNQLLLRCLKSGLRGP